MPGRSLRSIGRPLQVGGLLAFVAAIVLTMTYGAGRSAAAGVTVTVTPNSGLHNGQTVHVQASGLPANHASVQVVECAQGATDSAQCDGNTLDVSNDSDASGNYDNPSYTVLTRSMSNHDSINCDATNPCEIYVGTDYNNHFATESGTADISFSDSVPTTTEPPTTVPPSTTTTTPTGTTTTTTGTGSMTTTSSGATTTTDPNATTTTAVSGASSGSGGSSGSGTDVSGSSASASGSTLPLTSAPPLAPWLAGFGLIAFVSGTAVRRSALRAAAQSA